MSRFSVRALLVGAILLPLSAALAGGERIQEMAEAVGLSPEQTTQVEDILHDHQLAQIDAHAKVKKARLELRTLMDAPTVDEKAVRKAFDVLMAAEEEQGRNRLEMALSLRKVMSYEQWRQAEALRQEEREDRREHRRGGPEREEGEEEEED